MGHSRPPTHVHRNLQPLREHGPEDGDLVAKVCPECHDLFHPITGKPVGIGTRLWQDAHEVMRAHLEDVSKDKRRPRKERKRARSVL